MTALLDQKKRALNKRLKQERMDRILVAAHRAFLRFPYAEVTMDYRAWNFTQEDNYCRLHLDRAGSRLEVTVKDEDGNVVKRGRRRLTGRLTLARW